MTAVRIRVWVGRELKTRLAKVGTTIDADEGALTKATRLDVRVANARITKHGCASVCIG